MTAVLKILFPLLLFPRVDLTVSSSFYAFLQEHFKEKTEAIVRNDLGPQGSYGGGAHLAGTSTKRAPVIFVHGMSGTAGTTVSVRNYFLAHGYAEEELYATTYGSGQPILLEGPLKCEYVKAIRSLIYSVAAYANSTVSVIAYSLGVPLSRKAIAGGTCVDTGDKLGPPFTKLVRTFVGVVGPNYGVPRCTSLTVAACNLVNGLNCRSQFLQDINSKSHYEATNGVYAILSRADETVGYKVCGRRTADVNGAEAVYEKTALSHLRTCTQTIPLQFSLIAK